jgi:hypothetical protein
MLRKPHSSVLKLRAETGFQGFSGFFSDDVGKLSDSDMWCTHVPRAYDSFVEGAGKNPGNPGNPVRHPHAARAPPHARASVLLPPLNVSGDPR